MVGLRSRRGRVHDVDLAKDAMLENHVCEAAKSRKKDFYLDLARSGWICLMGGPRPDVKNAQEERMYGEGNDERQIPATDADEAKSGKRESQGNVIHNRTIIRLVNFCKRRSKIGLALPIRSELTFRFPLLPVAILYFRRDRRAKSPRQEAFAGNFPRK